MSKFLKLLRLVADPATAAKLGSLRYAGHLFERGWFESARTGTPVDRAGNSLPWMTYPLIAVLEERLRKDMDLFEFGSGGSTRFFSGRVATVHSVEHDRSWYDQISRNLPPNSKVQFCELQRDGEYCRVASKSGKKYDVVVVDGRDRVNCVTQSIPALKPDGVLILDDAQRVEYSPAHTALQSAGFKRLSFVGMAPGNVEEKHTDLFYRSSNCFGI